MPDLSRWMQECLFDPARHAPLSADAWNEGRARESIQCIVADTIHAASPIGLWPIHPEDKDGDTPAFYDLYLGAAGVVWALDDLKRSRVLDKDFRPDLDLRKWIAANRACFRGYDRVDSLLSGDAGLLITQFLRTADPATADALALAIEVNLDHPAMELMWGAPGSMLAALVMHRLTAEHRWSALYRHGAEILIAASAADESGWPLMWTQTLWGRRQQMLGLVHGFAGNARALIHGRSLLDPKQWETISEGLARTLELTAIWNDGLANWPSHAAAGERGRKMLLQICHGAPGMIVGLSDLDQPIDDLLIGGGEAIWRAGPLAKGSNLCHGTAGNGWAFLSLFRRTGDESWLSRARAFAMHAIAQCETERERYGLRRFSLWTGDLGVALFLNACLTGSPAFPTLA